MPQNNSFDIRIAIISGDTNWIDNFVSSITTNKQLVIVGMVSTGTEIVKTIRNLAPHITLIDTDLPWDAHDGICAAHEINNAFYSFDFRIMMISDNFSEKSVIESFNSGAANYLLKSNMASILEAIATASSNTSILDILAGEYGKLKSLSHIEKKLSVLSEAERNIIILYINRLSSVEIASVLSLTDDRVKLILSKSLSKLQVHDKKELLMTLGLYKE